VNQAKLRDLERRKEFQRQVQREREGNRLGGGTSVKQ